MLTVNEEKPSLHQTGFIDGDMYISNIMWCMSPNHPENFLNLIEWDTAFFAEDGILDLFQKTWECTHRRCLYKTWCSQADEAMNLRLLDAFMLRTLEQFFSHDKELWGEWMKLINWSDFRQHERHETARKDAAIPGVNLCPFKLPAE